MDEWIWQELNEKVLAQLLDSEIITMVENREDVEILEENLNEVESTQVKNPDSFTADQQWW